MLSPLNKIIYPLQEFAQNLYKMKMDGAAIERGEEDDKFR